MKGKINEKLKAIKLRQQGKSYNEILEFVPVAKSTLSLWLREVGLSRQQKQKLTDKKRASQQRGGAKRREMRLDETRLLNTLALKDVGVMSERDLFITGIALYWGEGAKRNADKPGVMTELGNSDPAILKIFIKWLKTFANISNDDFEIRLHLHINHKHRENIIKTIWAKELKLPVSHFAKTIYKKHNPRTIRKKKDSSYIGLVSVRVKKSTKLNRWIMGLIYAIIAEQK